MMRAAWLTSLGALAPTPAAACTICLASPYGDRSFNWAFVLFMLTPFAVAAALAGVLVWQLRVRRVANESTDSQGSS